MEERSLLKWGGGEVQDSIFRLFQRSFFRISLLVSLVSYSADVLWLQEWGFDYPDANHEGQDTLTARVA